MAGCDEPADCILNDELTPTITRDSRSDVQ
jgi:hypothetical protein